MAKRAPEATICLLSALARHDLTDVIPARQDIALPRDRWHPRLSAVVQWHIFEAATFDIGRTTVPVDETTTSACTTRPGPSWTPTAYGTRPARRSPTRRDADGYAAAANQRSFSRSHELSRGDVSTAARPRGTPMTAVRTPPPTRVTLAGSRILGAGSNAKAGTPGARGKGRALKTSYRWTSTRSWNPSSCSPTGCSAPLIRARHRSGPGRPAEPHPDYRSQPRVPSRLGVLRAAKEAPLGGSTAGLVDHLLVLVVEQLLEGAGGAW